MESKLKTFIAYTILASNILIPVLSLADDTFIDIDFSQNNSYGISVEYLENAEVMIKVPEKHKGVGLAYAHFFYRDQKVDKEKYLQVPLAIHDEKFLYFRAGKKMLKDLQVDITYKKPEYLCIEAIFQLSNFDLLDNKNINGQEKS